MKNFAYAADFKEAVDLDQTRQSGMLVFNELGVAVADADPDQLSSTSILAAEDSPILSIEPEPIFFAFGDGLPGDFSTYLRGYRDAVEHLYQKLAVRPSSTTAEVGLAAEAFQNTSRSFIPNQEVQDDNGHGTHCIGTACGSNRPSSGPRYGIAYEAEIFVGKVLSNQGSSLGRSTIAGIEWAVANGCHIVSMSLGGRVQPGQEQQQ